VSVLAVNDLSKVFVHGFTRRRTVAVERVSFEVERGEIFGFLGPNGAGKTTTMKMLMGLVHPTGGSATILGAPLGNRDAKNRLGYLPENPYFYDYLSALEFMHMVGHLHGLDPVVRRKRAIDLLDRVGLGEAGRRSMRGYSKGMLQRAGLAQALMGDPELVVLDEPMSGLDPIGRREVRDLMVELKKAGKTVFFSTHILSDADLLCDRVAIIVKGKLMDVGPLGALLNPRVHGIDVLWQGDASARERVRASVPALPHASGSEGETCACTTQAEVDALIAAVSGAGGSILQVTPHRETLEDLFTREAAAGKEPRA
jgi:ABC-2 type transport system ATP-binding protein